DEIARRNRLRLLPMKKQAAFLILLCDRMMPNAQQFGRDTGFSISIASDCIEKAWKFLSGDISCDYKSLSERCLQNAPDTDDYKHEFTSATLDTVLSVSNLMNFLHAPDIDLIIASITLAFDTIYLFIPTDDANSDSEIIKHPLMQQELVREEDDF